MYDKYPLNAWIYGLSFLSLLILPLIYLLVGWNFLEDLFTDYLTVMLFPYEFSKEYLFGVPFIGLVMMFISFALHAHVYCTIFERMVVILWGKFRATSR